MIGINVYLRISGTNARTWLGPYNASLIRDVVKQVRILQFYCNHLQLENVYRVSTLELFQHAKVTWSRPWNTTFKSAVKGTVNAGPRWFPSADNFFTTRWWPWLTSVMVTVERFCNKFTSSSSSSVFGCRYTLAGWGNCSTFVKYIGRHFTSKSFVLKYTGSSPSRNWWATPLQSTPSMPLLLHSPTLWLTWRMLKRMVFAGTFCLMWSKALSRIFSAYKVQCMHIIMKLIHEVQTVNCKSSCSQWAL